MKIKITIQIQKVDEFIIRDLETCHFTESDKHFLGNLTFSDRDVAIQYLESVVFSISETNNEDISHKIILILQDAADFIKSGTGEYITAKDRETWIKVEIE